MKFVGMKLTCRSLSVICFAVLPSFLACIIAAVNLPKNVTVPAVIVFGDSIVDAGNNDYIITSSQSNFPPYGKDFIGGKATGRFSNGKIPSDFLVEELGIKQLLPCSLDPSLEDQDLLTGVDFASAASGYDPLTSELSSVFSLSDQLEMFKEYIAKLQNIVGEERTSYILRESLVGVVFGNNDFVLNYIFTPLRKFQYDISSYTDLIVNYSSTFVQELYGLGARRIGVFSAPPFGCLPMVRTLSGRPERKCVDEYNVIAQTFNERLSNKITSLNTQLSEARVVYVDIFSPTLDIIRNPQKYGFEIANKGCCGTGTIDISYLCKHACSNVEDYVFWDGAHPTEKVYRILVRGLVEKYINDFI